MNRSLGSSDGYFEPAIAHQRWLTISDIRVGHTLNRQSFQGFSPPASRTTQSFYSKAIGKTKTHERIP
jgi:hypothetical protein